MPKIHIIQIIIALLTISVTSFAQYNPSFYMKSTEAAERIKTHERIIENVILKNLHYPLTDNTESNWQGAFNAMEVVNFTTPFTWQKMQEAMTALPFQSATFQRHVLEAAYALYPGDFISEATSLMRTTTDAKIFAMCAVYILKTNEEFSTSIKNLMHETFGDSADLQPILSRLNYYMDSGKNRTSAPEMVIKTVLSKNFLAGKTVLYSLQRKDRDYPGMALVRKKNGEFVKVNSEYFHVPQLARGIANLPYFLTKGNTPQGIYRMFGFGVSVSQFIGPTANIQMGMPVELKKNKFFDNTNDSDAWTIKDYARLLPASVRDYEPLYETFYAGQAGRNEIIAHGTTINPDLYKGKSYYPMTPTEGCLCTKEFWDGKLIYSDQQKLVNALLEAGGAYGYVVVLELDNKKSPVTLDEVFRFLD